MFYMVGCGDLIANSSEFKHKYRIIDTLDYAIDDCNEIEVRNLLRTGTVIENLGLQNNKIVCTQGDFSDYGGFLNCSRVTYTLIGVDNGNFVVCTNKKEVLKLTGVALINRGIRFTNIGISDLQRRYSEYFTRVSYEKTLISGLRFVPIFTDKTKDVALILDVISESAIFVDSKSVGVRFIESVGIPLDGIVCYYTYENRPLGFVQYANNRFNHIKVENITESAYQQFKEKTNNKYMPHINIKKEVTRC